MKLRALLVLMIISGWQSKGFLSTNYIRIEDLKFNGSSNEIVYKSKIVLASMSNLVFSISGMNYSSFTIFQAHCLHHNISISLESSAQKSVSQYGTNLGFLIPTSNTRKVFRLSNKNFDEVNCMISYIAYKKSSPVPGRCEIDYNSTSIDMIKMIEEESYATAIIPRSSEANKTCGDSQLTYETYYTYLDMLNFGPDVYFDGIEKMIFSQMRTTYRAKTVPDNHRHIFEAIPGRGLIINTLVKGRNGDIAFYIPVATYSCPPNTWSVHCTDTNFIKRGISILLIVHSIVMILNLMSPDFIESILNGMLIGAFTTTLLIKSYGIELQAFDYFIVIIIGACFVSAQFGIITLYLPIGRFLSKVTFSAFLTCGIMEIFFDSIISIYLQLIIASILSMILSFASITFSVLTGSLILVLNLSYLSKIGNLHRIVMNNFLAITAPPFEGTDESYFDFIRLNYINYRISLNFVDFGLILSYIAMSIYFTLRKERFFFGHPTVVQNDNIFTDSANIQTLNCENARRRKHQCIVGIRRTGRRGSYRVISRCRRHLHFRSNLINERSPLISHWLTGSDDENERFSTPPESSSNVRIRITHDSDEDLDGIKKCPEGESGN